jgi:hypothetical protein
VPFWLALPKRPESACLVCTVQGCDFLFSTTADVKFGCVESVSQFYFRPIFL